MFFHKRHKTYKRKCLSAEDDFLPQEAQKAQKRAAGLLRSPAALPYVWLCGGWIRRAGRRRRLVGLTAVGRRAESQGTSPCRAGWGGQRKMYLARKRRVRRYMMGLMERARPAASERTVQEMTPSEMPSAML